jgi:hypothetical protein
MKLLAVLLALPLVAAAAILPDEIGSFHRASTGQPPLADRPIWGEYGIKAYENGAYDNGKDKFTATVWELADTTGALGAFDWQRPAQATPSQAAKLAAETKDSLTLVHGNYLFRFDGYKPSKEELDALYAALKNVDNTSLPVLSGYLPEEALVANSERYVTGPAGLERFAPGIPPSVAAFHFGAEAQVGVFHNPKGDLTLAIFNYPTHQIAMQKLPDFEKLPGAMAKRSGPLIAVVVSPADPDHAEKLLAQVRFQAEVTRDEYVPTKRDNIGVLIVNIFSLIGILLAFALVSGLALGGVRAVFRRGRKGEDAEGMITLHLTR